MHQSIITCLSQRCFQDGIKEEGGLENGGNFHLSFKKRCRCTKHEAKSTKLFLQVFHSTKQEKSDADELGFQPEVEKILSNFMNAAE